ncbi:MAG TPA: DUF4241 domain-containing protein [bacterium]|nr:DUF4241 domain-containing protein [bacterium]
MGGNFRFRNELVEVHAFPAGRIAIRSGRVTVCDPLSAWELEPLARKVPNGSHEVWLAVAGFPGGDRRVAAALLRFGYGEPVRWEMATREGESLSDLEPGKIFAYGVDAGTGCFADAGVASQLADEGVQQRLADALEATYEHTWSWANVEIGGAGVAAFSSGWGDGAYASYWGFDAAGKLIALCTDFGVLLEPIEEVMHFDPRGPFNDPQLAAAGVSITPATSNRRGGIAFELRSSRSVEVDVVDAAGNRATVASEMSSQGDRRVYDYDALPAGTRLRIAVLMGLRPVRPA